MERGKAGSFQFGLPPTNRYYDSLRKLKTIITVELDNAEIFRGRVLSIERGFNNMRTIYCEGDLAYLVDTPQKGEKYVGTTHDLFRRIIEKHNARIEPEKQFRVGEIGIDDREIILTGQSDTTTDEDGEHFDYTQIAVNALVDQWKTTYDYIDTSLIETCGGFLRTRRVGDVTYLDLLGDDGIPAQQSIEYGVNMLDLTEGDSAEELFTVLIPLGDKNLTVESVNEGSDELVDEEMVEIYGRVVKTYVFQNVTEPSTLMENGLRYLATHANVPSTLTVRAVDMHLQDKDVPLIQVGMSVPIHSAPHGLHRHLVCTKIEYNLDKLSDSTFSFGTLKPSLTERYRKDKNKTSSGGGSGAAAEAVEEVAESISDKFYDAWINVDPETGHVDLGTVYEELKDAKAVLTNECGISFDAPNGDVNLYNLKTQIDENTGALLEQAAKIDLINTNTKAAVEIVAARTDTLEENKEALSAEIHVIAEKADELGAKIKMKADQVDVDAIKIDLNAHAERLNTAESGNAEAKVNISALSKSLDNLSDKVTTTEAKITTLANDTESSVSQVASRVTDTETKIASITTIVDEHGSQISAKADRYTVNSKFTEINSEITSMKQLIATKVSADEINSRISEAVISQTKILVSDTISVGVLRITKTASWNNAVLATRDWVKEQLTSYASTSHSHAWADITDKPTSYTPTKHRHSFSYSATAPNGHVHTVTVDGKAYSTGGVSTNVSHTISGSGNTGYYPTT